MLDYIGAHTLEAAKKLVAIMRGKDPQQSRLAAEALLDRRLGKPMQALDVVAHRGLDAGAVGGNPDQARARLEALIAAQVGGALAGVTDVGPVAHAAKTESLQPVGESGADGVAKPWPGEPPEGER